MLSVFVIWGSVPACHFPDEQFSKLLTSNHLSGVLQFSKQMNLFPKQRLIWVKLFGMGETFTRTFTTQAAFSGFSKKKTFSSILENFHLFCFLSNRIRFTQPSALPTCSIFKKYFCKNNHFESLWFGK